MMRVHARSLLGGIGLALLLCPQSARAWESGEIRLRGRLQTRYEIADKDEEDGGGWYNRFELRRARLDGRWDPSGWVRLVLELEAADGAELMDAYGRLSIHDAFRVQAGHFKKPFSRLKMDSAWEIPLPVRGLLNRDGIATDSHGGYGDRDLGLMLSGRFKKLLRLRYFVGVFTGPGIVDGEGEERKDFVGRIQFRPFKGFRLAVDASHKLYTDEEGITRTRNLFGADARFKIGDFGLQLEGAYGDNLEAGPDEVAHRLWGAHGIATYALKLGEDWVLTPAFMVEVFDPDDRASGRVVRLAGALNLDVYAKLRVVLFAEGALGELEIHYHNDVSDVERRVPTRIMAQLNLAF
ncbi:MAG: hypothetical protein JXR96_07205 [Deltaproteobacteria bacterium]|nr:hypothetical protein [Deltaproteobacteria bacterium]